MRIAVGFLLMILLAAADARMALAANAPEPVRIAGAGLVLDALLYRPDGDGPFPAVVALHGCAGLGKHGLAARYRDWAERLVSIGFAVLHCYGISITSLNFHVAFRGGNSQALSSFGKRSQRLDAT